MDTGRALAMASCRCALTIAAMLLACPATPSLAADPAWPAMQKIGMTGTWASSCAGPPIVDNTFDTYYGEPGGRAGYRSNRGEADGIANVTILEARVLTPTTIRTLLRYDDPKWGRANGLSYDVVSEIVGGKRMRTLKSVGPDGKVLIDNGKLTANGQPIGSQEKCKD